MFADERGSNPAKKRADEAKARRLRAKREAEARQLRKRRELERREREAARASGGGDDGDGHVENEDHDTSTSAAAATAAAAAETGAEAASKPSVAAATPPSSSVSLEIAARPPAQQEGGQQQLTAAQRAAEQRRVRAASRARAHAAVSIQSVVRMRLVAARTRDEQRSVFDGRVSDLIALAGLLRRNDTTAGAPSAEPYVPPPATVSIMTAQFLFFACPSTLRKEGARSGGRVTIRDGGSTVLGGRDLSRFAKLVTHLLLPGVSRDDLELDPLVPWMDTAGGTRRLRKVLNLCVSSVSCAAGGGGGSSSAECYPVVGAFLRTVLRLGPSVGKGGTATVYQGGSRDAVCQKSRAILMQPSLPDGIITKDKERNGNTATKTCGCDVIYALRLILLYGSTRTNSPIPGDAGRLRENCVTGDEKARAGMMMKLVIDFMSSEELGGADQMALHCLRSRFIREVLTVPLLTWKVEPSSYEGLLRSSPGRSPPLVDYIHGFINLNAGDVSCGSVESALSIPDVSMASCPAPPVLCLLANIVQLGRSCDSLNAVNPKRLNYKAAAEYFNFLATLINSAPLGTFSSRMSAVEWVSTGSSSTPIVLSEVVVEQAASMLSDSYVRALFTCAIDEDELNVSHVINTKTDKDKGHEKDLEEIGTSSAATVAAKEAMVDRNRSFWQTSKWAKKLTSLLSGPGEKEKPKSSKSGKGVGKLLNTSSISRQLANGKAPVNRTITNAVLTSKSSSADGDKASGDKQPHHKYSVLFLLALCRAYGTIISRWGGNGKEDLVRRAQTSLDNAKQGRPAASPTMEACVTSLLNVLCFSTSFVTSSWAVVQSNPRVVSDLYAVIDVKKRPAPIRTLTSHPIYKHMQHTHFGAGDGNVGAVVLSMFVACLCHTLIVTDDVEIHDMEKPLPKHQLRRCIVLLKKLLYRACCLDDVHDETKVGKGMESDHFGLALISASSKAMTDLYSRSSRRFICAPKLWIEDSLLEQDLRRCKKQSDYTSLLSIPCLRICPYLVSFKRRLKLFERIVTTNRFDIQGSNEHRNLKPGIMVKVMRGRVLEDGLAHLNKLGRDMRQRIVICWINEGGTRESGIDVGGLFKEFWEDLSKLSFDPNYALFKTTEGSLMYPNPSSKTAHGSDHIVLFEFLGRILGKALYEGITIQPQFAHLFLSFLKGDHTYLHLLTDLSTIDPQLYNNLMFLKTYDGDCRDLCLTFTVANDDFGVSEVPLIANGAEIEVTNQNKRRYIYLVAKHHVSDRIKEQSDAFTRGLWDVIDRSWLRLFNEPELQVLISGASDGKIDVADMKSNTRYVGGYTMLDRNIVRFWNVVSSLSPEDQANLLRFVTSCERPPPLGFASMSPPLTIQRVGILRDADKLPSASTCFNILKLPTYSSEKVLREKLTYVIRSGAGFELT